jgi:hypothetical protein
MILLQHHRPLVGLVSVVLLAIGCHAWTVTHDTNPPRIPSILADSEAICRTIAPAEGTLTFSYFVWQGPGRPLCEVECDTNDRKRVATLTWDAETSELCVASCPWIGPARQAPLMGDTRSVRSAYY